MFSYAFMTRAFIVGILVSLCASLLGVSLVLRRLAMIGDGLSHVGFFALALASVLGWAPLSVTLPVVVVAAVFLIKISEKSRMGSESSLAMLSASAMALGVMAISFVKGTNTDINNYLFGSLLAVGKSDAVFSIVLSVAVLAAYVFLYPRLFAVTFDPVFSRSAGLRTDIYMLLLAVLSALTIVLGMRMMGALLISAIIIFPSLSAMRVFRTYRSVTISSAVISMVAFMIGITLSFHMGTPVGASIVCTHLVIFIVFWITGKALKRGR